MDDCLIFAATSFWANPDNYWAMAKVLIGLGAVIFVHELGHFLLAKACGVKCEKFYVGFDAFDIKIGDRVIIPRSLVKYQWGETEYGIGILPLGGYVKMLGQIDNPGDIEGEVARSMNEGETTESAMLESGLVDKTKIDPRSYLAKSVPQRMAIISAGVIFNLIFAVVFAALAFKSSVNYVPPVIGNVVGGGPAWQHDLEGAKLLRIGNEKVEGYFTYMDMAQEVMFNTDEKPLEVEYIPYGESTPKVIQITPQKGFLREAKDLALIGVNAAQIPKIGSMGAIAGNTASLAKPEFQPNDLIVEVNGTKILTGIDLRRALAKDADKSIEFVLERSDKDELTTTIRTTVAPNPMRRVGFSLGWQPIAVIKFGSPAETAGLNVGDELLEIDGQPRGDLLTLNMRMIRAARENQTVELTVLRADEELVISIPPIVPKMISEVGPNKPIAIDSLGIAIPITREIETIEANSPAADSGLAIGDKISKITYLLSETQKKNDAYTELKKDPLVELVKDDTSWAEILSLLQLMEAGTKLELEVERDGQPLKLQTQTVASTDFFQHKRGIALTSLEYVYQSDSWGDAFTNGYYRVVGDIKRVGVTLLKLLSGKISPKNLGGPGTIALAATSEATQGNSRLLLFLTFLSANLAIVNFLPIPVLDGGHMLFLAWEGVTRKPVSEKVQILLTYAGLLMILGLMLFVIFLDVGRISSLL